MLTITNFREGELVNYRHGIETSHSLTVNIQAVNTFGTPVKINGTQATQNGLSFSAPVELTGKINCIEAVTDTPYGEFSQKLTLVWDKKSFRRCNFYIDDNIFLFTDLARQRPARAFDHFYLQELKKLHDKYGLKITLNCFCHNSHEKFLLQEMPDIWKSEFEDNSAWLKFALHAYSEFPDRPYAEASRRDFLRDYELFKNEVERFAGKSSFIVPAVLHWNNLSSGVADELIKLGCRCYSESMRHRMMSTPPVDELTAAEQDEEFRSEIYIPPTEPLARHYGFAEEIGFMEQHGARYDKGLGIFFYHDWIICNLLDAAQIPRLFDRVKTTADNFRCDLFSAGGHEQYSFPRYHNYQPDHFRKLDITARLMVEKAGCTPVFYQDGLLGNPAWDD